MVLSAASCYTLCMKTFIQENKITIGVVLGSLALYGVISYFSKPLAVPREEATKKVEIPLANVKQYDLVADAKPVEAGIAPLHYKLFFPSSVTRETKNEGRETVFYYDGMKVAVLTFVYVGKKGPTPFNYTKDILGARLPLAIDPKELKIGNFNYITAGSADSYFRIGSFKKGEWLGALEIVSDNEGFEHILLDKLEVK